MGLVLSAETQSQAPQRTPMRQLHVCFQPSLQSCSSFKMEERFHGLFVDIDLTDHGFIVIEQGSEDAHDPSSSNDHYVQPAAAVPGAPTYGGYGSDGETEEEDVVPNRKKGGYDSRVEQILYEDPSLPILIIDAGKSQEGGGKYIVYTIRTGVCNFSIFYDI